MIIIFGIRRLRKALGPVLLRCANCGMSPVGLLRVSTWFALFFIPVIPVNFKHYTVCPNCKRIDQIPKADLERARAQGNVIEAADHKEDGEISSQPATLEHAVNEWASVGNVQSPSSDPTPAFAPRYPAHGASSPPLPAAGWYPDPAGTGTQRYWDGRQWTEHTTSTA